MSNTTPLNGTPPLGGLLPAGILAILATEHGVTADAVAVIDGHYGALLTAARGFPPVAALTPADAEWLAFLGLAVDADLTYAEFREIVDEKIAADTAARDIWRPDLNPQSNWMQTTRGFGLDSTEMGTFFDRHCHWSALSDLEAKWTAHPRLAQTLVELICTRLSALLPQPIGKSGCTFEFRHARTITLLAGYGLKTLGVAAQALASADPSWQALTPGSSANADRIIAKAQRHCGYPASWMRLPWRVVGPLLNAYENYSDAAVVRVAAHVLAHVRVDLIDRQKPRLHVAYEGRFAQLNLDPENLHLPLAQQGMGAIKAITTTLGLATKVKDKKNNSTAKVLDAIHLHHLMSLENASVSGDYLVGPSVQFDQAPTAADAVLDAGIAVKGVAIIDAATGKITPNGRVTGSDALQYNWQPMAAYAARITKFHAALPDIVRSERPSAVILAAIHNVNDLGHRVGLAALLDAILVIDFLRNDQAMSGPVAGIIGNEFPPIVILSNDATLEGSTNQGKTALGRAIGGVMVPGITEVVFNRHSGAPAARSMAEAIEKHGTTIFDEFVLPSASDHPFGKESLQSLATGGSIATGKATQNAAPMGLDHPLLLITKIAAFPPDLFNRMYAVFLDKITDSTTCTPTELAHIMNGRVATQARLSMIRWIRQTGIAELISHLELSSTWRFNGTAAVAEFIAGEKHDDVGAYLAAATDRALALRQKADVSGLAGDLHLDSGFSLAGLLDLLSPEELAILAQESAAKGGFRLQEALLAFYVGTRLSGIARENPARDIVLEYRKPIQGLVTMMGRQLAERPVEVAGYRVRRVLITDKHKNQVPMVVIEAIAPTPT